MRRATRSSHHVPADSSLRGAVLVFQAGHFHRTTNRLEFTNPAAIVIG